METISESVTSHFKSFCHFYNSMFRVFAIDDRKECSFGECAQAYQGEGVGEEEENSGKTKKN